jgi:ankyrin repeat protein
MSTVTTTPSQYASMTGEGYAVGACSADRLALVALLLAEGADVDVIDVGGWNELDCGGVSPLSLACSHGLVDAVELLISRGVDINLWVGKYSIVAGQLTSTSIACPTALHRACAGGH